MSTVTNWCPKRAASPWASSFTPVTKMPSNRAASFRRQYRSNVEAQTRHWSCRRGSEGVEIVTEGRRSSFGLRTRWLFHELEPWIDVTYELEDGWSAAPQSVQFCFPLNVTGPTYRYDTAGAVLKAGAASANGDDLPGANPSLWATQTFAAAHGPEAHVLILTPDACLVQFGAGAIEKPEMVAARIPSGNHFHADDEPHAERQAVRSGRPAAVAVPIPSRAAGTRPVRAAALCPGDAAVRHSRLSFRCPASNQLLPAVRDLDISFEGGPVTAVKRAEDKSRLIVRLWNVLDQPVPGSLRLPEGYGTAEACDALERPLKSIDVRGTRAVFEVPAQGIMTVVLKRS